MRQNRKAIDDSSMVWSVGRTTLEAEPAIEAFDRASIRHQPQNLLMSRENSTGEMIHAIRTETDLVALALRLGARDVAGWSPAVAASLIAEAYTWAAATDVTAAMALIVKPRASSIATFAGVSL